MRLTWIAISVLMAAAFCTAQESSLADQVAAAEKQPKSVSLNSEAAGRVVNGDYQNTLLGLEVHRLPDWQSMSRGEMNVSEAEGREQMGMKGAVHSGHRVFGMHDLRGASLFVSVAPLPQGTDTRNLKEQLQAPLRMQLPDPQFSDEPVTLSDSSHPFVGFRVFYKLNEKPIYQSQQTLVKDGHVVAFVLTANSPEDLTAIWQDLKTKIVWTK